MEFLKFAQEVWVLQVLNTVDCLKTNRLWYRFSGSFCTLSFSCRRFCLQNFLPSGCGERTTLCQGQGECAAALAAHRRVEKAFEACRSEEDEKSWAGALWHHRNTTPVATRRSLIGNFYIKTGGRRPTVFVPNLTWMNFYIIEQGKTAKGGAARQRIIVVRWN